MDAGIPETNYNRSACTECQRRKQKCNREWPCNHCQKRKVAAKCRFQQTNPSLEKSRGTQEVKRKRRSTVDDDDDIVTGNTSSSDEGLGVENLGYMTGDLFAKLGIESKKDQSHGIQDWLDADSSPQLARALKTLPPRAYMDTLIQSFFNDVNFHYYIIYPPTFLQEYHRWWDRRSQRQPVSLQWTCLLIAVCACATQHLDVDRQKRIQVEFGEAADKLATRYQTVARELANAIPVGHYHIYNVQRLMHWCYWYKSEAKFPESWHVLSSAVREAQELGFHQEPVKDPLSEFDREIRRRIWCIMDTWDWQISSGLCRPTIIDRSDCRVELPTLALEDYSPSPLMHMKMQSQLIGELSHRFAVPKNITSPAEVQEYQMIVERWMQRFPPVYSLKNPDKSIDARHPWVTFHRYYIWTMGFLMIMNPIRPFMSKVFTRDSPEADVKIRSDGIYYALKLMSTLRQWVDFASHEDGRFHFIIFSLFDTAAVLSTAVIKDVQYTIPRRDEILDAIDLAVSMLRRLTTLSSTAKTSYDILSRLVQRVPRNGSPSPGKERKKSRVSPAASTPAVRRTPAGSPDTSGTVPVASQIANRNSASPNYFPYQGTPGSSPERDAYRSDSSINSATMYSMPSSIATTMANIPASHPMTLAMMPQVPVYTAPPTSEPMGNFGVITDSEIGDFSAVWDWQSLNLDFISSQNPNGTGYYPFV